MSTAILTRDDIAKLLFREDFFAGNPAFAPLEDAVRQCKADWEASAAKSSCGCGGAARAVFACLDALLAHMETLRAENPGALNVFIQYVRVARNDQRIRSVTVYYRKTAEEPMLKVRFP